MDLDIRPVGPERFDDVARVDLYAFGETGSKEDLELHRAVFEPERSLAVFDGDDIVGTAGIYSFQLTVPGAFLPTAGVTGVAVLPTHRRRGLLRALMRRQLDEVHDRGEPLAALWASEGGIYQRFGYGLGAFSTSFDIRREWTAFVSSEEVGGRVRLVERGPAMAAFPGVYERVRSERSGFLDRKEARLELRFADQESERDGATPFFYGLYESPTGHVDGYVVYRVKSAWNDFMPGAEVLVEELMAATPEAYAALWRYCFGIDLVGRIRAWHRAVDEPLLVMLAEPRRLRFAVRDGLWLRVVDVPSALEGRRYAAEGRVVLGVRDQFCPWNEGRFELEAGPEGGRCGASLGRPDIELDVAALAAAYLGGTSFRTLARAGRAEEATPGALRRADSMFATDPAPWCPEVF